MALAERLARAGFVAAEEEAAELTAAAGGDRAALEALVRRRLTGEPLAWILGGTEFCGRWIRVHPGVYVPRVQTEALARRAAARLPADGVALDLCTGSGAIAAVLQAARPGASVLATDADARAVACARANGVDARQGDLFAAVPAELAGRADVIVAVVPYVPTGELRLLQRDTFAWETTLAYDGGADGLDLARRVVAGARRFGRPGGALLLELGDDQVAPVRELLGDVTVIEDEEGDVRGVEAVML